MPRSPRILGSLKLGELEGGSFGVLKKRPQTGTHHSKTPVLQYSEINCNLNSIGWVRFFEIIDP